MIEQFKRLAPAIVFVLALCFLIVMMRPNKQLVNSEFDLRRFAALPVTSDGRIKPLDTVARTNLMLISGRQTFTLEKNGQKISAQPAIKWWLDVASQRDEAMDYKVFRIDHPDVLAILGKSNEDGVRFSLNTLLEKKDDLLTQVEQVQKVEPKLRNPYQKAVMELYGHLVLYTQTMRLDSPLIVPPDETGEWKSLATAFKEFQEGKPAAQGAAFVRLLDAYKQGKSDDFNRELDVFETMSEKAVPGEIGRVRYEVFFNNWEPFYLSMILYVTAFLLACFGLMLHSTADRANALPAREADTTAGTTWAHSLTSAASWLIVLTLAVHTFGLASRIYLQGRPPVTNLYSSAVFIGWACVLLCVFLERIHKVGLGSIVGGAIGFVTLIIAQHLSTTGDTLEMMRAVLDSNFWLSTHVVTVTLGYSATFLAGFLAILYIFLGVFTTFLRDDVAKKFVKMVYGVIAFALLLSFVGTVLGGIWADQSWGRFWGWDPKENGAVLIVLMNALILHARWAGMVKDRGLMALAVGGNIITSWSWFGTNMLGVGLHSYGFMDSAMSALLAFVGSQLVIIGIALLPDAHWRSKKAGLAQKRDGAKKALAEGRG